MTVSHDGVKSRSSLVSLPGLAVGAMISLWGWYDSGSYINHTHVTGSLRAEPVGELGKYFPALKTMSHKTIACPQCSTIETPGTSLVNSERGYHY